MDKRQIYRKNNHGIGKAIDSYLRAFPVMKAESGECCPCSSGYKYSSCCAPKGIKYRILWKKENGASVAVDDRSYRKAATELLAWLDKARTQGINSLGHGLRYLRTLYERYDVLVRLFEGFVSCRRGCTACCYYLVGTSFLEAELIRRYAARYLNRKQLETIRARVKEQLPHYIREKERPCNVRKDEELLAAYFKKRIPCPFLDRDSECMIYPVRPFTCRSHSALSEPYTCETGEGLELLDVMGLTSLIASTLVEVSAVFFGDGRWEHIGLWLAQ